MLNPGDRFGDYEVVRLLGKGGMGAVFLLENAEGAQVAAKILCTHPPRRGVPAVLSKTLVVNGKIIQRPDVNGREWTDLTVDLSEWAGRNVLIELLNMPTGWQHEEAHWQRLEIR